MNPPKFPRHFASHLNRVDQSVQRFKKDLISGRSSVTESVASREPIDFQCPQLGEIDPPIGMGIRRLCVRITSTRAVESYARCVVFVVFRPHGSLSICPSSGSNPERRASARNVKWRDHGGTKPCKPFPTLHLRRNLRDETPHFLGNGAESSQFCRRPA